MLWFELFHLPTNLKIFPIILLFLRFHNWEDSSTIEANCYSLCFILYKTSCPELLVIVSCRNLGTNLNCVYESGGSTWNGFTAKETDSKPWISKGWHRSPLVQIKGHRHYSSAEMNTTIHSRHSTVSDWLRYPGFFLDHYFVSYVLGLFLSIIVSPVEEHQIWYDKHQQRNRTWQKRGSCHVSWGLGSFFLLSRM